MLRGLGRFFLGAALAAPVGCCTALLAQGGGNAQGGADYDRVDAYATVLRILREGLCAESDGQQHATLIALRDLHDPTLAPLFRALVGGDRWTLRVDGLLGLAELSPNGKVDLGMLERLPGERDRDAAMTAVLALKLADAEQIRTMLGWVDLPSSQRVLLAGELRRLGESPDEALLTRLAGSRTPEVAALSACLLLDMKSPEAAQIASTARAQIAALPAASRSAAVAQVAEACASDGLVGAAPFVAELLSMPDLADDARMRGVGSLLTLAPAAAYPLVQAAIAADPSLGSLMRQASVMLASGARAPAEVWASFASDDPTMRSIVEAGTALTAGDERRAYGLLVGLQRRVILRAALDGARRIGPSAERALALACLDLVLEPGPTPPQLSETLLVALFRLAESSPEELRAPLAAADLDEPTREAILMALLNAGTKEAALVAETASGKTSRLGQGQISVLHARNASSLTPQELDELVLVAGGAVKVALPIRLQAAWLWLRHANRCDDAIAALRPQGSHDPAASQGEIR